MLCDKSTAQFKIHMPSIQTHIWRFSLMQRLTKLDSVQRWLTSRRIAWRMISVQETKHCWLSKMDRSLMEQSPIWMQLNGQWLPSDFTHSQSQSLYNLNSSVCILCSSPLYWHKLRNFCLTLSPFFHLWSCLDNVSQLSQFFGSCHANLQKKCWDPLD